MKIGAIGFGCAGMAAAWLLDEAHEVTLFERNAERAGHVTDTPRPAVAAAT